MSIYMIGGITGMVIIETNVKCIENVITNISKVNVGDDIHISVRFRSTNNTRVVLPIESPTSWPGLAMALSKCGEDIDGKSIYMEIEMKFSPMFFSSPYAYLKVKIDQKIFKFQVRLSREEYNEIGEKFFSVDAKEAGMKSACFMIQKEFFGDGLH